LDDDNFYEWIHTNAVFISSPRERTMESAAWYLTGLMNETAFDDVVISVKAYEIEKNK